MKQTDIAIQLLQEAFPGITLERIEAAMDAPAGRLVGTREACKMLSCSVCTLMRWSRRGDIRASHPSRRKVLYSAEDIKRLLERAAAERADAILIELSERERAIVDALGKDA